MSDNNELDILHQDQCQCDGCSNENSVAEIAEIVKVEADECNCNEQKCDQAEKRKRKRCAENLVTKFEGLLMFVFVLLIVGISAVQIQNTIVECGDKMVAEIEHLENKVIMLENELAELEDKFDDYRNEQNSKPINITVNVDKDGNSYICDPENGCVVEDPTVDTAPEFNTHPFLPCF